MAMHPKEIPKGARVTAAWAGTIEAPGTANHGRKARAEIREGFASQGYKTEYERKPTRWIAVWVEGCRPWASRYSGARYQLAIGEWDRIRSLIKKEPMTDFSPDGGKGEEKGEEFDATS